MVSFTPEHSEYEVLSRSIQPADVSSSVAVKFKLNAEKRWSCVRGTDRPGHHHLKD
jgi:hypothetical protein